VGVATVYRMINALVDIAMIERIDIIKYTGRNGDGP
jgi:Fe2+ or Zn2+ uptake regulation protein